jgi:hypothetical protein
VRHAAPGDTVFDHLKAGATIQGHSQVAVSNAEAKVLGLIAPNDAATQDGFATFHTDIPTYSTEAHHDAMTLAMHLHSITAM